MSILGRQNRDMKIRSKYLLAFLTIAVIAAGCIKTDTGNYSGGPALVPDGVFTGQFTLIHENTSTNRLDTAQATITLTMVALGTTYSVGGDTTKIQAPSKGSFGVDQVNGAITFVDATITKTTPANTPKKHLNGTYLYTYDGTKLHIVGANDTLSYDYSLSH
jgi:hypothetical protein